MKCLEKDRSRRYETASGLALDIQRYLADEPVLAGPPSASYRLRKFVRRHRGAVLAAGLVLLALVGGMAGTSWGLVRAEREREFAETMAYDAKMAAEQANTQRGLAVERGAEMERSLYLSHMHLAQRAWDDPDIERVLGLLEVHRTRTGPNDPDLRGFEWYYLWRLCHSDMLTLKGHTEGATSVCFSPDGRRLASASQDRTVKVWNAATGEELLSLKGHEDQIRSVCFSPDGRRLASASLDQTVKVWDAQTGREIRTLVGHTVPVRSVCFSPDGQRLASADGDVTNPGRMHRSPGEVKIWDAQTGREILSF
jgi:hypothetical protein